MESWECGKRSGSSGRAKINAITSAPVPEEDLPPGVTACRFCNFDRSDQGVQMHIREFGLCCIRLQEPVQHPLLLVRSVDLTMYGGLSKTYPSEVGDMSAAILATCCLVASGPLSPLTPMSASLASVIRKRSLIHAPRILSLHEPTNCVDPVCRIWRPRS
jgi:hypothetical protein